MKRELTQFSMAEFRLFVAAKPEAPAGTRDRAMLQFEKYLAQPGAADYVAGVDNIQRVRVLGDPEVPSDTLVFDFELQTKLPPHLVEQKKREADRAEHAKKTAELLADPARLAVALVRAASLLVERANATKPAEKKKPHNKNRTKSANPRTPAEIFRAAQEQDQSNRRRAAKEAAEKYKKEKLTKKAS